MSSNETALQAQKSGFMILADNDLIAAMSEELLGLDMQFSKIKIPAGGGIAFEIPGEDGEAESVKEFTAVIVHQHAVNAYYKTAFSGGHNPPDCGSIDGITGKGDPGGDCMSCPLNAFGTKENGGKACQNRFHLFLLREGELFPMLLSLPAGSRQVIRDYMKLLISRGRRAKGVVTRFSLKKATSNSGVTYSQAQFKLDVPVGLALGPQSAVCP